MSKSSMFLISALLWGASLQAGTAIIVHPSNSNALDAFQISQIFLTKMKTFPDGSEALPVFLPVDHPVFDAFLRLVINKNLAQFKAYFGKLIFTGRGTPPKVVDTDDEMLELIARNPNLIGMVDETKVTDKVKVVAIF